MDCIDLFDLNECYSWFEYVVHGREDVTTNEDDPYDACCAEFIECLQSLKSPPLVRIAGPKMLRVLHDWLGAEDERLKIYVKPVCQTLILRIRGNDSLGQRLVTSVLFCLICVFDVYQWPLQDIAALYWSWVWHLLTCGDQTTCDLQKLISPMIISLVLKPTVTAADIALLTLVERLQEASTEDMNQFILQESGFEIIRRVLDTFLLGFKSSDDSDAIYSLVHTLVVQSCKLQATNPRLRCPLSNSIQSIQASPSLVTANMILTQILPFLTQAKAKTKESQNACALPLKALAAGAPNLFNRKDTLKTEFEFVQNSNPAETTSDEEMAEEEERPKKRIKKGPLVLFSNLCSPWLGFVSMVLCTVPERKDCRERTCSILVDCLANYKTFLNELIPVIRSLSCFHDRGIVRLASIELAVHLSLASNTPTVTVLDDLLTRASDLNAIVRARALELLAQVIQSDLAQPSSAQEKMDDNIDCSPFVAISATNNECKEDNDPVRAAWWRRLKSLMHARVLDEKSVVRKGLIPLIEVAWRVELETQRNIVERQLLESLADDVTITVRQRLVSTLISMTESWLNERAEDREAGALVFVQLFRLASDAEEAIYGKVLDYMNDYFLPALRCETASTSKPLLTVITGDDEALEWFTRAVIRLVDSRCSDTSPWVSGELCKLIKAMSSNMRESRLMRLLLSLICAVNNASAAAAPKSGLGASLASAALQVYEQTVTVLADESFLKYNSWALQLLSHLAPVYIDDKNKKYIRDTLFQALIDSRVHASIILQCAQLTISLEKSANDITETCMAFLSVSKRRLSKFRIPDGKDTHESLLQCDLDDESLISAALLSGFSCLTQVTLQCPKLAKYIQQINKALAVTTIAITRYHASEKVRLVNMVAASHILLVSEGLAKKHMARLIQTSIQSEVSLLLNNLAFSAYDFSVCHTSVMDPYLTLITSSLSASSTSAETRYAILQLVSRLVGLDYIKCKGLIMHHFIYALGDPCEEVRSLAFNIMQTVLLPRLKDLVLVYFVEQVCLMTGYYDHPGGIRPFDIVHPLQKEVLKNTIEVNVRAFQCLENRQRRVLIYSQLLALSQEQSKHLLTGKLVQDFLKPLSARDDLLPTDGLTPSGAAIADVLQIIASADMKLRFKGAGATASGDVEAEVEAVVKVKYERELITSYLTQNVIPVLTTLFHALRKKNSTLQTNAVEAIVDILGELNCSIEDIVSDRSLRRRLEEVKIGKAPSEAIFNPLCEGTRKRLSECF